MIKSESRRSNLFSSLKSRKSIKDLSSRTLKSSVPAPLNLVSEPTPLPLSEHDTNTMLRRYSRISGPVADGQENPASKRNSIFLRKKTFSPSSEITLATMSTTPSELNSLDTVSIEADSPPISHECTGELSPLDLEDFSHYLSIDEPATPYRLHRTTNIGDIKRFMELDSLLPLCNRKSLEVEAHEMQQHQTRMSGEDVSMRLVENVLFMSFYQQSVQDHFNLQTRYWDDLEDDALKLDDDSSINDYLHL